MAQRQQCWRIYKCIRKYEASVERPFSTFSAASKLLLRLQQWSQLWRSSGTKPEPCFEDLKRRACEQAQALPAITGDRVEQYMRRAPLKAPGPDGWTPHLMRALTAEQCHRLASIMRQAELNGSFPEQWSVSLVILLPKNLEIERPIALMHVLLKAWMKLRWRLLEQWQESFASQGWWDSCGPGHSCLDVAVRRLIQYESSQILIPLAGAPDEQELETKKPPPGTVCVSGRAPRVTGEIDRDRFRRVTLVCWSRGRGPSAAGRRRCGACDGRQRCGACDGRGRGGGGRTPAATAGPATGAIA